MHLVLHDTGTFTLRIVCCFVTVNAVAAAMQSQTSRAAIAQLRSTSDKYRNLIDCAKCAGWAKREGAQMLFLPECFGFLGESGQQTVSRAEPPILASSEIDQQPHIKDALRSTVSSCAYGSNGADQTEISDDSNNHNEVSLLDGLKIIARESGCWLSAGGMHESGAPPAPAEGGSEAKPRVYNSHVIIDSDGNVKAMYRKSHLFDVSIPNKVNLRESVTTAPGEELVVCDSPVGLLGLSTCYDVRFPEMYVELVQRGAQILLVPSAFTIPTGKAHWHALLTARAIENQCYVLAPAQVGKHNDKRMSYGHALAVDPWGDVIADAGGYDGAGTLSADKYNEDKEAISPVEVPSIVLCDIDHGKIKSVRERMPIQQHRDNAVIKFR